jgi:hypothetical protein
MAGSKAIPKSPKTAPNCASTVIFFPVAPFIPEWQIFKMLQRVDRRRCHGVSAVSDPIIDYHRALSRPVEPALTERGNWGLADDDGQIGWRTE